MDELIIVTYQIQNESKSFQSKLDKIIADGSVNFTNASKRVYNDYMNKEQDTFLHRNRLLSARNYDQERVQECQAFVAEDLEFIRQEIDVELTKAELIYKENLQTECNDLSKFCGKFDGLHKDGSDRIEFYRALRVRDKEINQQLIAEAESLKHRFKTLKSECDKAYDQTLNRIILVNADLQQFALVLILNERMKIKDICAKLSQFHKKPAFVCNIQHIDTNDNNDDENDNNDNPI